MHTASLLALPCNTTGPEASKDVWVSAEKDDLTETDRQTDSSNHSSQGMVGKIKSN